MKIGPNFRTQILNLFSSSNSSKAWSSLNYLTDLRLSGLTWIFSFSNSSKAWSSLNCLTGIQLSWSTWIFFCLRTCSFLDFFGGWSTEYYYIPMNSSTLEFFWRMIKKQRCQLDPTWRRNPTILKVHETYLGNFLQFLQFLVSKNFFFYCIKCEYFIML